MTFFRISALIVFLTFISFDVLAASPAPPGPAQGIPPWNNPYPSDQDQIMIDGGPGQSRRNRPAYREKKDNEPLPGKMREAMHEQFMDNPDYALADGLLNATWKQIKANLSSSEYEEIQDEQRYWVSKGRAIEANRLLSNMTLVEAFTEVTMARVDTLARLVARSPRSGKYSAIHAEFYVRNSGGTVTVEGNAWSDRGHTCDFEGYEVEGNSPWRRFKHSDDDLNDFYILFTNYGAGIYYRGSEMAQGCGSGAGFNYTYKRDR